MKIKILHIVLLVVFAMQLLRILDASDFGFTKSSPWYTHFTYMFFHASIFHLIINLISIDFLIKFADKYFKSSVYVSFIAAFVLSFFAGMDDPTIGVSGVIYFLFGSYLANINKARYWAGGILFIFINIATFLIAHKTNTVLHISCFIAGTTYLFTYKSILLRSIKNERHDL